ncbi:acyltransferase family protein [Chryseobacterium sp. C-71]|uniref:acyltransferase n=1 Tax=Chryseobacterium sp. C-71 TaxID=2893882 RepID=UPI001E56590A|nr:acyltransferase family protein [Chryseobacterium sp. C-71]UFH32251.1 acyltransferase family protein [Chryseobacterium sp. C-71]
MKSRDLNIDALRVLACFLVIIIHVSGPIFTKSDINSNVFLFNLGLDSFSRVAVPLFVMISGRYLIKTDRVFDKTKYFKSILKILRPLFFWSIIYIAIYVLFKFIKHESIDYKLLLDNLIKGKPYYHLWYLYMILGVYIVAPFFNQMLGSLTKKQILYLTWGLIIFSFIHQSYNYFYNVKDFFGVWFIDYIGYAMLGYIYKERIFVKPHLLFAGYIFSSLCILILSYYTFLINNKLPFFNYNSIFVIAGSFFIYRYFDNLTIKNSFILKFSENTFGIYLIHPLLILIFFNYIKNFFLLELLCILIIFLLSNYVIKLLSMNTTLKKYLM